MNTDPFVYTKAGYLSATTKRLLTFLSALVALFCIISCRKYGRSLPTSDPDTLYTNSLPTHSLEERKRDILDLLTEAEHEPTLTKKHVEVGMGKPDSIEATGSKEHVDRKILTTYFYRLPPGEYEVSKTKKISLSDRARAHISFSERGTHGLDGCPVSIRDDTAPLVHIELEVADDERYPHIFRSIWSWRRGN